jgi:hypothetical protein
MSRAENRKFHYIYKTTCSVTNKFYIGMHSTDKLEDGYKGSGKMLWYSIRKHGKENHTTEILEHLPSREELKLRESILVNEELLGDVLCMNLCLGGGHGWDYVHKSGFHSKGAISANKTEAKRKVSSDVGRRTMNRLHSEGKLDDIDFGAGFRGRTHSEETKIKMREAKIGVQCNEKNSQYGTCWIYSLLEKKNIKINKEVLLDYLELGWSKGRKIVF